MYAKLLITNKSKENNVQYIFCVADNYQKVVETHHTVSPSFIESIDTSAFQCCPPQPGWIWVLTFLFVSTAFTLVAEITLQTVCHRKICMNTIKRNT